MRERFGSYEIYEKLGAGGLAAVHLAKSRAISNPVALKHLRGMQPDDQLIIYETGDQKSAVGTAKVLAVEPSDARNPRVEIEAGKALVKPVPLSEIKANKLFADSPLVHQGRLSVVPLTPAQVRALAGE